MKKIMIAMLFVAMTLPALQLSANETTPNNSENLVEVCVTYFNPADGSVRSQRTIVLREARATAVVEFYNANPSAVIGFELGACE